MLITRLVEFAHNAGLAGADPFFETKPVRWLLVIAPGGRFVQLLKLGDGPKGISYSGVPKKVGGNAGGVATFGVDNPRFVLGYTEDPADAAKADRALEAFTALVAMAAAQYPAEEEFQAAAAFYGSSGQLEAARAAATSNKVKDGDRIALAASTANNIPIFDSMAGRAFWRGHRQAQEAGRTQQETVLCLSCGQERPPVLTGEKIQGLTNVGGIAMGTSLLSFDRPAFRSLGWEQNKNAPVCSECSLAYTRGLNDLLLHGKHPKRTRIDEGGTAFLFWLDSGSAGDFIDNLFEAPDSEEAEQVLTAARTGVLPPESPERRLFALGLRGNGGRAVVTDWFDTSLADAHRNLARWFDDLQVTLARDYWRNGSVAAKAGDPSPPPSLHLLVRALFRTNKAYKEDKDLRAAPILRAALRESQLPLSIAVTCLHHLPKVNPDIGGVNPPLGFDDHLAPARIGLIRCTLNRRNYGERRIMASLDHLNTDPAYVLGRTLATLEAIQYAAVGRVGANIIRRYYGKASTAPGITFGPILALAQSHLGTLSSRDYVRYVKLDKDLSEVLGSLAGFPKTLSAEQQGAFALGYYHQKAARFADVNGPSDDNDEDEGVN